MALVLKLRPGRTFTVGEARITVSYARRGEVRLIIEAPPTLRVKPLPRDGAPADVAPFEDDSDKMPF